MTRVKITIDVTYLKPDVKSKTCPNFTDSEEGEDFPPIPFEVIIGFPWFVNQESPEEIDKWFGIVDRPKVIKEETSTIMQIKKKFRW